MTLNILHKSKDCKLSFVSNLGKKYCKGEWPWCLSMHFSFKFIRIRQGRRFICDIFDVSVIIFPCLCAWKWVKGTFFCDSGTVNKDTFSFCGRTNCLVSVLSMCKIKHHRGDVSFNKMWKITFRTGWFSTCSDECLCAMTREILT